MFRVYDYTDATRLFGEGFITKPPRTGGGPGPQPPPPPEPTRSAPSPASSSGGNKGLENPQIFQTPEVRLAGGLAALQTAGNPRDLLIETKTRMFAA